MLRQDLQDEFKALLPGNGDGTATRRAALKAAMGLGYAAAAAPIMAQTAVKTSSEGLTTGEISFEVNGFRVPAFRAQPAGKTNLPVVLVIHEVFGVHEYIADTAMRFAQAGYLAIAPELFARQGDPAVYGELARLLSEVVAKVPDAQVMADLDGAVKWAGANGGNVRKLGITGFCWGGRITWLYAAHRPLGAGVAWYGRIMGDKTDLTPSNPIDIATELKAPVLGLYGGADTGITQEHVDAMRAELAKGNALSKESRIVVYPGAPHAFHADYRSSYREDAAKDGYARALAWFKAHGVA